MDFKNNNPSDIYSNQWEQLKLAVKDPKHNYHLFALSTIDTNSPNIRTVVLRNVNENEHLISFHTDIRSPKFTQITKNPNVSGLFYDIQSRTQIRMIGTASTCSDENILRSLWDKLSKDSKECYMGEIAPSNPLNGETIINKLERNNPDQGYKNFTRVDIYVSKMEVLLLHHLGHRRIEFKLDNNGYNHRWLAS
tara:strand:+ start:827 stop:1408 length:582 start_codon:yes stop_codon:yes gene_type:complete